ncbi:MAG: C40 family peptidase [Paludibacteraceae bacterium]|nr:C40 family peptidase [Paludibacteraceae bacterium]
MKKILAFVFALVATTSLVRGAEFVVNNCPVTPVREEPSEAAEQATQLLFGQVCEVVERKSSWVKIRCTVDGQVGWVSRKMTTPVSEEDVRLLDENRKANGEGVVATPMTVVTDTETGEKLMLTIGTRLPNYRKGTFEVLGKQYKIDPKAVYTLTFKDQKVLVNGKEVTGEDVVRVAKLLLNVSYLWGGKNMMGYDCSGFTQTVYSVFGIDILRNAREQVTQGQVVKSLAEAQPGDLVFFDHADRDPNATRITHVGMLISPTEVIHCAGWVHVAKIDDMGIRLANGKLSHHLAQIKRYL